MPRLLAIETSTDAGSIAVLGEGLSFEECSLPGQPHSGWALPAVTRVLGRAGLRLDDLDAIAFGAGPGSFTGLRLACGIAQGLALGADLPLVAVPSLAALALASGGQRVWVGVDARMREMYYAAYAVHGDDVQTLIEPACAAPELVPAPEGEGWHAAGSALSVYREMLLPMLAGHCVAFEPEVAASARAVARIAAARLARGEGVDAALAAPLYVRDKVALTTAERLARGGRA
ncbi:MAG: tRNA (adenosine(37)-N6)-threonylcarbamoyltransferase complex dimerization subunit type 1 TsaB [Sterolibacteriaceae bacterium]|nr:tRNA (adenosine(37)-N6)-threonylcarbamoyltransferase complex dimerization subunit type 1 TsaB [Candidatus Methylophosphatis haderslevensis]